MKFLSLPVSILQIIILLNCLEVQGQVDTPKMRSIPETQIDSIFSQFDDRAKPGAAVAVVMDDALVFKKGYGSANLEYDIPVSPSTVFHIASVSKQFTVFSILLLEREGKLSLDDDIRKYIPEVPDFGVTITLKHLASHTSGLRDQWDLLGLAGWRFDDIITREHILKLVAKQKELNFNPGEEYTYCNTGFTLLAEVVARVSGKSFAAFAEENIFEPLDMSSTLFYDDHERIVKNRAYSYYTDDSGYKKSVLNYANVGATSLFTTVEDLALWSLNFSKPIVGNKEIIEKMNTLAVLNNGKTFGGAYGQFVDTHKGLNQIQHGGADAGYRSYLGRFPDQNFAVMVFSNLASSNPVALALQVADLYLADLYEKKEEETAAGSGPSNYIKLDQEQLELFSGHYWNEAGQYSRKIYIKNDTLTYNRGEGNESALLPISKSEFKMLDVPADLTVRFQNTGNKRTMVVVIGTEEPIVSEEFTPPAYTPGELEKFIGTYYSPELSTSYRLLIRDGKLVATHSRHPDVDLTALKSDLFSFSPGTIKFDRNQESVITGLRVSTGRVRNLWFGKTN